MSFNKFNNKVAWMLDSKYRYDIKIKILPLCNGCHDIVLLNM